MSRIQRSVRRASVPLRVPALLAVLAATLLGCGGPQESPAAAQEPAAAAAPADDGIRLAVVGDSLTAAGGLITEADGAQPAEPLGDQSWVLGVEGAPLVLEGGWAMDGATTAQMRDEVSPADADVVVVMGGTNDLLKGIPWDETRENVLGVVDTVGVERVVLSAVPPLDSQPAESVALNDRLGDLAADEGWEFVDPWTEFAQEGTYRPGASTDGIHPVSVAAFAAGRTIRDTLLEG